MNALAVLRQELLEKEQVLDHCLDEKEKNEEKAKQKKVSDLANKRNRIEQQSHRGVGHVVAQTFGKYVPPPASDESVGINSSLFYVIFEILLQARVNKLENFWETLRTNGMWDQVPPLEDWAKKYYQSPGVSIRNCPPVGGGDGVFGEEQVSMLVDVDVDDY